MQEHRIQALLDALARHELALKALYEDFASAFPERADFWNERALEENRHARWIRELQRSAAHNEVEINPDVFPHKAVLRSLRHIEGQRYLTLNRRLGDVQALATALDLENAVIERRFFRAFDLDVPGFRKLKRNIERETREHRSRIAEAMEAAKTDTRAFAPAARHGEGAPARPLSTIKAIVQWLQSVEDLAGRVYGEASRAFTRDAELSRLLAKLADEETWHFHLMGSAESLLAKMPERPRPAVSVGIATRTRVERPLRRCEALLRSKTVDKELVLDCIVQSEYSEWNDIFVYVIQTFQKSSLHFQHIAATIEGHRKRTERFLATHAPKYPLAHRLRDLPPVWVPHYLVVCENPATRDLLVRVLSQDGKAVGAATGREAQALMKKDFWNAVVCNADIGTKAMQALLQQEQESDLEAGKRLLVLCDPKAIETRALCRRYGVRRIPKPVRVGYLRHFVREIADAGI